jgi:hypothetical protein
VENEQHIQIEAEPKIVEQKEDAGSFIEQNAVFV